MAPSTRPSHFLTIRLKDPDLLTNLRAVHEHFVRRDETIKNYIEPVSTAHITLNVLKVEDENLQESSTDLIQRKTNCDSVTGTEGADS